MTDRCYERHGKAATLDFLKAVTWAYPAGNCVWSATNYHTHQHADVGAWLVENARVTL